MQQAVIRTPTQFELQSVPLPALRSDDELLLRTAACGICSGDLMEWYMQRKIGRVLGHEVVGYAEEVGPYHRDIQPGDLVFAHHHAPCGECRLCRAGDYVHCPTWRTSALDPGGMAEFIRVPSVNARIDSFAVKDLAPEIAVFIEPLACSVKALSRVPPGPRDVGVIVGCGVMGLLNILAAKALGTKTVWAVEPDEDRRAMAAQCGADGTYAPDQFMEFLNSPAGDFADYAVAGPGHPAVIAGATQYVRSGGTVVQFTSTPFGVDTPLDLSTLYFREVSVVPSYSCGPRDTRDAYRLLCEGKLDVAPLVTHRFPLDQIQTAYDTAKRGGSVLKVLVTF